MEKPVQRKLVILGVVYNDKGEVLLTERLDPEFPGAHLKWDIPGGAHELGETLEATCLRELLEETGYEVAIDSMIPFHYEHTWHSPQRTLEVVVLGFKCRLVGGTPHLEDHKINDIRWVAPSEIYELPLLAGTPEFIEAANRVV